MNDEHAASSFLAQVATAVKKGERLTTALRDPEVALPLSQIVIQKGQDPEPIRLVFAKPDGSAAAHFEVDLKEARASYRPREIVNKRGNIKGHRHYFNESVTHVSHFEAKNGQGYILCVNFGQPRILLLKDDKSRAVVSREMEFEV